MYMNINMNFMAALSIRKATKEEALRPVMNSDRHAGYASRCVLSGKNGIYMGAVIFPLHRKSKHI